MALGLGLQEGGGGGSSKWRVYRAYRPRMVVFDKRRPPPGPKSTLNNDLIFCMGFKQLL